MLRMLARAMTRVYTPVLKISLQQHYERSTMKGSPPLAPWLWSGKYLVLCFAGAARDATTPMLYWLMRK
ncbi:hypothetical protein IF2G_01674 [Cordyceps javanica]|nr:hypothetical protein IF2G_01674 [Cordyceps javanica]